MTRLLSALAVLAATVVTVQAVPVQSPPAGVFGGPISPSNPHGIAPPMPGYGVQNITWKILVDPKNKPGELTTFAGTIQQAVAQAVAINPNYLADHGLDAARYDIHKHHNMTNPIPYKGNSSDVHHLPPPHPPYHKLDGEDKQVNDLKCFDEDLPGANLRAIDMGIDYLVSLSGVPGNGVPGEDAAPKNCGRVSCSWGSAIWWCNDGPEHIDLTSWWQIGFGAQDIARNCYKWDEARQDFVTSGRNFFTDGDKKWHVTVKEDLSGGC